MLEVELKFPVSDLDAVLKKIVALGAVAGAEQSQVDHYFNHPARDFAQTNEAFRLRRIGDESRLTYKGPVLDKQTKMRKEIEFPLAAGDAVASQCREMLVLLGFRPVREVHKRRVPYHYREGDRNIEIAADRVEELGNFIEIETLSEESESQKASARDAILDLATRLGLSNLEPRSYLCMLLERLSTESDQRLLQSKG